MENLIAALKAVADPTRVRLLALLSRSELAVADLTGLVQQSQPRVSRHLKILTDAGLIERHKEGSWVFYRLPVGSVYGALVQAVLDAQALRPDAMVRDAQRLALLLGQRALEAQRFFDAHAGQWDQIRSLHVADADVESAVLGLFANQPIASLLDVGTGTGRMLELLAPLATRGVGIDNSPEMLALARARLIDCNIHHCQVRRADFYALPGEDAQHDAILFHHVLHFADDPRAALREAARVLAPDGRIVIVDFASHDHDEFRERFGHRRLGFSDEQIASYLAAANLHCTTVQHLTQGTLNVTLWLARP